jgi:NADPH:quinone reductase-like Zn-dependent oxidoreductase
VQLAHQAGARVIATFRSEGDKEIASRAGADEVLLTGERGRDAGVTQNLPTMRTLENLCTVVSLSG